MKNIKMSTRLNVVIMLALISSLVSGCLPGKTTPIAAPTTVEEPLATEELAPTQETMNTEKPTTVPEPTNTTPGATEKSQVVMLIAEDPPSFNALVADTGYDALIMELVMLGLTDIDPKNNVFPELAAELPTQENGGVVVDEESGAMDVTWKLRQDVTWADGKPVTSEDVIFTYDALADPEMGVWIEGLDYIDSLEQVNDYTFIVHYNAIYPGYLTQFGGDQVVIWPAHYCDASQGFVQWDCAQKPLSNGPYSLTEWMAGDHLTFERNPNYYQKGKPSIDSVIVRIVPDNSVRKTMLINGDADIIVWVTEEMIGELLSHTSINVSISPTNRWFMRLFFNLAAKGTIDPVASPHPILSDVRVRQAIRQAIDVDLISNTVFEGYAQPAWTEFNRAPYICSNIHRPQYDPDAAIALLEEAGWTDQDGDGVRECHGCTTAEEGYVMKMEFITYAEYGESLELSQQLIGEMLGKIGIKLTLTVMEGSVLWGTYAEDGVEQAGNFDIDMWDDGYAGIDPTDFLWETYATDAAEPDAGWNVGRWSNPDFDSLLEQAYTLDQATRQELFCQMATILDEEAPSFLLFSAINADAYLVQLQGVQSNSNDLITWNIADWIYK